MQVCHLVWSGVVSILHPCERFHFKLKCFQASWHRWSLCSVSPSASPGQGRSVAGSSFLCSSNPVCPLCNFPPAPLWFHSKGKLSSHRQDPVPLHPHITLPAGSRPPSLGHLMDALVSPCPWHAGHLVMLLGDTHQLLLLSCPRSILTFTQRPNATPWEQIQVSQRSQAERAVLAVVLESSIGIKPLGFPDWSRSPVKLRRDPLELCSDAQRCFLWHPQSCHEEAAPHKMAARCSP